jgi:hypothetical protein
LITSLDLASANPSFSWATKRNILTDLGVSEDQFLDIGILIGFDIYPAFPPTMHDQALKATVDMVKYYKTGHQTVGAFGDHPSVKGSNYMEHYARTRAMIKFSLILSSEGTVMPLPLAITSPASSGGSNNHHSHQLTAADIPIDLHDVFTNRLPDEIYYYLSRGLLSPQPLVWLTSGQVVEHPPLDNGETNEYRRFVKEVITDGQTGPRATVLALISNVCHTYWTNRKVQPHFWFDYGPGAPHVQTKPIAHNSQQTVQLAERVSGWHVAYGIIEEELRRQNVSCVLLTHTKYT